MLKKNALMDGRHQLTHLHESVVNPLHLKECHLVGWGVVAYAEDSEESSNIGK